MPSNTLALGLYERCILKRTFRHTTGFCRFREEERRRLSRADNFLQQLRRSGVSRVRGEKVAAARTEKLCTHSHTHSLTHLHTGRLLGLSCKNASHQKKIPQDQIWLPKLVLLGLFWAAKTSPHLPKEVLMGDH